MPNFSIADIVVQMNPSYEETAYWYEPYLTDKPLSFDKPLTCRQEDINYLATKGVGITEAIAENVLLCNLFNRLLIRFDGSFIHSSAMMFNNKVYLVSGDSGVGKSTLTKRWCRLFPVNTKVINDDKPSFRIIDGKCIIYGTPFAGGTDIQCNESAELGAIVFLEQAQEDKLIRLSSAEAFSHLYKQTPKRFTPAETEKLLSLYEVILNNYPIYKLYCTDSDNAVHTVLEITE